MFAAALLQLCLICISTKSQVTCRKMNYGNASVVGGVRENLKHDVKKMSLESLPTSSIQKYKTCYSKK